MNFIETIEKIQKLGPISYVAIHIFEDEVAPKTSVVVKDVLGQEIEILLQDIFGYNNTQLYVLISLLMSKVLECVILPFDTDEAISEARGKYPYTGTQWLNERESRLYDHIAPEKMF